MHYCIREIQLCSFAKTIPFCNKIRNRQGDAEINVKALDATTLLYKDFTFIITGTFSSFNTIDDSVQKDKSNVIDILLYQPGSKTNDVIIRRSENEELQRAVDGTKNDAILIR